MSAGGVEARAVQPGGLPPAWHRFDSQDAWEDALAELLAAALTREDPWPAAVMLSGGRTPLPVYRRVAGRAPRLRAGGRIHVLCSDERVVPPESPDSNAGNAAFLVRALNLPEARILRVHTELGAEAAAAQWDRDLRAFLAGGGRITLGLLGLGIDGHTAGLFTERDLEAGSGRMAVAVARPDGLAGVTVTPGFLCRVDRLVILASAAGKQDVLRRLAAQAADVIALRAVAAAPHVQVWIGP